MAKPLAHASESHTPASLKAYITGFVISLVLTLTAYVLVRNHTTSTTQAITSPVLIGIVLTLAMAQFITQLIFFLHLGTETKPRWKLMVFYFMVIIVVIFVGGSLWIMGNLNNHMSTQQINSYMNSQDGI
jgi:cytochrome o ubiquinol oxidase operon protein cyoD